MAKRFSRAIAVAIAVATLPGSAVAGQQDELVPRTEVSGPVLAFDWPAIEIGVGSYEEGPTGLTIIHFPKGASAAVDVRGGSPGTVNTDSLRLASAAPFLDAIVVSGGSSFGEEAITSVTTGLKERRNARGEGGEIDFVTGAIIYDFRQHRLNEIYPDKRLAWATLDALRPGVFPLGAQGAGSAAVQGGFTGCRSYSGQGGAFREVAGVKIAAFTVVNALGSIVDREGRVVRCARHPEWGADEKIQDILARLGTDTIHVPAGPLGMTENTTISVIVTNRRMNAAELNRLAVQVHTSMARGIQPFSTAADGDTLFAVSTQEIESDLLPNGQLNAIAGEVMWDAVLASVPEEAAPRLSGDAAVTPRRLAGLAGRYEFGPGSIMEVSVQDGRLMLLSNAPTFFDIPHDRAIPLNAIGASDFYVDGRYQTRVSFVPGDGDVGAEMVVNPGEWAQRGRRVEARPGSR